MRYQLTIADGRTIVAHVVTFRESTKIIRIVGERKHRWCAHVVGCGHRLDWFEMPPIWRVDKSEAIADAEHCLLALGFRPVEKESSDA